MWDRGWLAGVLAVGMAAVAGCSSSGSSAGQGGAGGQAAGQGGTSGASSAGTGGTTVASPGAAGGSPAGGAGASGNVASGGSSATGNGGAIGGGASGTSGAATAAGGTGPATGAGGAGPLTGVGGTGPAPGAGGVMGTPTGGAPGSACAGTALTNCAGTMTGGWCVDTFFQGNANPPTLSNVWSDGPTDVWAVGSTGDPVTFQVDANGVAVHWDGCAWRQSPLTITAGLHDVWGASATDVWAVGFAGTALHWDGNAWSSFPTGTTGDLGAVSGTSGSDVWAVGLGGAFHWNGSAWAAVPGLPPSEPSLALYDGDVWAVAPDDVWVALGLPDGLAHFDGTSWTRIATPHPSFGLFGIWADGSTGWAVGEGRQIMHLAGGTWTQYQVPNGSSQGYVNVMGLGGDVWINGQAVVEGNAGGGFQDVGGLPAGFYRGLWLTSSQVWMTGNLNSGGVVVVHRAR